MCPTVARLLSDTDVDLKENPLLASTMIDCFLAGTTNGRLVLQALFDDALDEPVPERLLGLVRRAR